MNTGRENIFRNIEAGSLVLASVLTLASLLYLSGYELNGFYLWALSPYVGFFIFSRFITTPSSFAALAGCIVAVLMFVLTVFVYIDGLFVHTSSTSSLLFLFVPLYLLIGGPLAFGLMLGIRRLIQRHGHENT